MAELSVIRPLWWLQGTGAAVGGSIDIGLHEIGLSGEATVLAIGPCDVASRETRPGMGIVTGTIWHRNATVWDLTFDDRTEETLGVTANHPLYSETRHAWIPAGDLQLDEVVRTLNGHSTLTARTQRPTQETVFNLEVHRSHAYHVSELGVLAHNTGLPCPEIVAESSRRRALDAAQRHAQVPRPSRGSHVEIIDGTDLNGKGANYARIKGEGGTHFGRRDRNTGAHFEDHPDGHPGLPGVPHHELPHVHGVDRNGVKKIFTYPDGT